jgi:hypothetical protein
MLLSDSWHLSPQKTDPLSWFTRPLIPLIFAFTAVVYGFGVTLFTWELANEPWLDLIAIALVFGACIIVQLATRPLRKPYSSRQALVPLSLALVAIAMSTYGSLESDVLVQYWWVPIGVGILLGALAPYSSPLALAVYAAVLVVAVSVGAWIAFMGAAVVWPAFTTMAIAASGVIVAGVATTTFSLVIVRTTQKLLAGTGTGTTEPESAAESEEVARQVERRTLARLGTQVAPFLESVAESGVVTDADRALAGLLARRLRSDLVSQANRSWLESLALYGAMYVVDPDHRADTMNTVQRAALRGLILAVMKNPSTHSDSLFIELRGQEDDSTAVALSIDIDLPEGRRTMMLAPYYLTLQTAVQDLEWDPSRELLKFQFPSQG